MTARGRPRSEQTRRAILAAARDLVNEVGYEHLTIQGIASRAGSGRSTVQRWWSSKAMIVAELISAGDVQAPHARVPDSGDLAADLMTWLDEVLTLFEDSSARAVLLGLITSAAGDENERQLLYDTSTGPIRRALMDRLERGVELGHVGSSRDAAAIAEALIGTLLFRVLIPAAQPLPSATVIQTLLGRPQEYDTVTDPQR